MQEEVKDLACLAEESKGQNGTNLTSKIDSYERKELLKKRRC